MTNTTTPDPTRPPGSTPEDAAPDRTDPVTDTKNDGAGAHREREMRKNLRDAEGEESIGGPASDDPDAVS